MLIQDNWILNSQLCEVEVDPDKTGNLQGIGIQATVRWDGLVCLEI